MQANNMNNGRPSIGGQSNNTQQDPFANSKQGSELEEMLRKTTNDNENLKQ